MKAILVALAMLLSAGLEVALAADVIDPALVATWKLEWQRADLFWAIRSDGVYRLHGPGATARQLGKIEAKQGRFSMKAPLWADSGTYKLSNADTLVITGKLGPGTWQRVWTPTKTGAKEPAGPGACGLLAADEVAQVLRAPVTSGPDPGRVRAGACSGHSWGHSTRSQSASGRTGGASFRIIGSLGRRA